MGRADATASKRGKTVASNINNAKPLIKKAVSLMSRRIPDSLKNTRAITPAANTPSAVETQGKLAERSPWASASGATRVATGRIPNKAIEVIRIAIRIGDRIPFLARAEPIRMLALGRRGSR
jgi:hypothetical protein